MKKLFILILMFIAFISMSNAQCPAPVVGTGAMKPQKVGQHFRIYMVKSANHSVYYDVEYFKDGVSQGVRTCQGSHAGNYTLIGITKDVYPGIENNDKVVVRVHCNPAVSTLGQCQADNNLSLPTDPITVKLPN